MAPRDNKSIRKVKALVMVFASSHVSYTEKIKEDATARILDIMLRGMKEKKVALEEKRQEAIEGALAGTTG